jgi:putative transcriptional regulator
VILICDHSAQGAIGLMVNKPLPDITFADLMAQMKIPQTTDGRQIPILFGGPVERARGFVLHSTDYAGGPATIRVGDVFGMTATLDVLEALAEGDGPAQAVLALGYSGWGPGQLEAEIARNDWLTVEASAALIFGAADGAKWAAALKEIGIDPLTLSPTSGRA